MAKKNIQKEIKELKLSNDPHIHTRSILFNEDESEIEDKNKLQFITCTKASLDVVFTDSSKITLYAPKGTKFDGATIPFGIGKGNMKLLIPALFHDLLCNDKKLINYDRKLSSEIFYKALLACEVNKLVAWCMYKAVDVYQIPIWAIEEKKWMQRK